MKDEVVLLAVTKMLSGFCIGGISLSSGKWVRPVKDHGTILLGDIRYGDGGYMQPFDIVRFDLPAERPRPPHVEDWICDFVHNRPEPIDRLEGKSRLDFCRDHARVGSEKLIVASEFSLALPEPLPTAALFSLDDYSGKYDARIYLPGVEEGRGIPVTDLKWRALGRRLLEGGQNPLKLSSSRLKTLLGVETIYVALGLSRQYEGRCWPLAIGVHTFPDYEAEVDYTRP